jgi:predicted hydrocarbon binding protein
MEASSSPQLRPVLGDFASIVCTKAIVVGVEQALGERAAHVALIAAGRARGRQLTAHLAGSNIPLADTAEILNTAIGVSGTRLCIVNKVEEDGTAIRVSLSETLCSAGEAQGSPRILTFTMGAIQGAFEQLTGRQLKARQIESVLRGGAYDTIELNNRI